MNARARENGEGREGERERVNFVAKCDQKHYGYQNTFKV